MSWAEIRIRDSGIGLAYSGLHWLAVPVVIDALPGPHECLLSFVRGHAYDCSMKVRSAVAPAINIEGSRCRSATRFHSWSPTALCGSGLRVEGSPVAASTRICLTTCSSA